MKKSIKSKIIFQKKEVNFLTLEGQKNVARSMIFELTGLAVKHSETGRPTIDKFSDVSISHKSDSVCVGMVPFPYRVGIDVEHLKSNINSELFLKTVITKSEGIFLKKFCKSKKILISSGISILWSIKEAFFKCLDYDLKPAKISILSIGKDGEVLIDYSEEIKSIMMSRKLEFCFAKVDFNKKHVYSQVVMKTCV